MRAILLVVTFLEACASGGWERVGPRMYAIECRSMLDCYADARDVCPYGYQVGAVSSRTTGATAHQVGSAVIVNTRNRGELLVTCNPPVFCSSQQECAQSGMRCVGSKKYPGRAVCADR